MAEFPALPLWTDAWLADTFHLARAVRGLYMDWLILIWRSPGCRVPRDLTWSARKLQCTVEELEPVRDEFLSSDGNWLYQKRLMHEFVQRQKYGRKQSGRAKSRWRKEKDVCRGNAIRGNAPFPSLSIDSDSNESVSIGSRPKKARAKTPIPKRWKPTDHGFDQAVAVMTSTATVNTEVEKFIAHHTAHGKLMADWDAAWRTWIGNYSTFNHKGNGNGAAKRSNIDVIKDFLAEGEAERKRRGQGDQPDLRLISRRRETDS